VIDNAPADVPDLPATGFALHPCAPNPFNPRTRIAFELPHAAEVRLSIYDMAGRRVRVLIDSESYGGGRSEVDWNSQDDAGRTVSAGTYFCRMESGGFAATRRMTLVK